MAARIFLGLSALVWLPYGIYCFLVPTSLAEAAGVAFTSPTGSTELRAMYGGLQAGIGLLAGLGAVRDSLRRPALVALAFLTGGLVTTRLLGATLDGGFSSYTNSAVVFELTSVVVATWLLSRSTAA
jgi:hypothetical protein